MTRDFQRSRVYAAEHQLRWMRDNGCDTVELGGVTLQLEPEARFGDLGSITRYVDRVLAMPCVVARFGQCPTIKVRHRNGARAAHYERATNTLAVHTSGDRFAMRELAVLHEIAHALTRSDAAHGSLFTAALVELVDIVVGPQTALALRMVYAASGVRVG